MLHHVSFTHIRNWSMPNKMLCALLNYTQCLPDIPLTCSNYPLKYRCQFVWCMQRDWESGIKLLLHFRAGMLTFIHSDYLRLGTFIIFLAWSSVPRWNGGGHLSMCTAVQRTWNFIAKLTCGFHSETINLRSTASQLITHGSIWECGTTFPAFRNPERWNAHIYRFNIRKWSEPRLTAHIVSTP